MKVIGELVPKAARHREYHWCRRENGFCDKPLWRAVASRLGVPAYQVIAFVNRLEELANATVPRGYVGDFAAAEFGCALGMPEEDAARIYAELERPEIAWIVQEHVESFYRRNPDREDLTATDRKRLSRARARAIKDLAQRARRGLITPAERHEREMMVLGAQTAADVAQILRGSTLSTGVTGHIVTTCDIVTVTPEQSKDLRSAANSVDNSGAEARSEAAGLADEELGGAYRAPRSGPELWLSTDGFEVVRDRLGVLSDEAGRRMQRWLTDIGHNVTALGEIIRSAEATDYRGEQFHNLVVRGVLQAKARAEPQQALPLVGEARRHG